LRVTACVSVGATALGLTDVCELNDEFFVSEYGEPYAMCWQWAA